MAQDRNYEAPIEDRTHYTVIINDNTLLQVECKLIHLFNQCLRDLAQDVQKGLHLEF